MPKMTKCSLKRNNYQDVLKYNQTEVGLCIADVAGHGVPAALLMSNFHAAVRIFASDNIPPREFCEKLNQRVCENSRPAKFITFFYGLLDAKFCKGIVADDLTLLMVSVE